MDGSQNNTAQKLFKGERRHFSLAKLVPSLRAAGLELTRVHQKRNNGQGKTHQLMLVFQAGMDPLPEGCLQEIVDTFLGTNIENSFGWTGFVDEKGPIGRVPEHVFVSCGNPRRLNGTEDNLTTRFRTFAEAAKRTGMVRVALNIYPDQAHLIPEWVPMRARHEDRMNAEAIRGLAEEL